MLGGWSGGQGCQGSSGRQAVGVVSRQAAHQAVNQGQEEWHQLVLAGGGGACWRLLVHGLRGRGAADRLLLPLRQSVVGGGLLLRAAVVLLLLLAAAALLLLVAAALLLLSAVLLRAGATPGHVGVARELLASTY